jgi:Ca-activated chloride channel family protein
VKTRATATPLKAAETLKENEIKLFCIGVGSSDGVPIPEPTGGFKKDRAGQIVLSRLDETILKKMAVVTGGTYVRSVAGDMDLEAIYTDEIRRTMEAQTVSSGRKQVWEDRFQWPLALALLCLVAELMLPVSRKTMLASLMAVLTLVSQQPADANDTHDGIAAYERGDFEQALKHFTDAQLNAPDNPATLFNVADAYYKTGNFDAAAEHYKQVLETNDNQLKRKALYNLGNTAFRRGQAKEAIGHYEAALAIDPDDRQTKENLNFVKKVMEQQQQQSKEGQKNQDQTDQDQKDNSKPKDGQSSASPEDQKQQQDGEQAQQRPEFGDEMDEQQEQSAAQADESQTDQQPSATPQIAQSGEPASDPQQTERMLNRLQDQPGRALMPATGKRMVEKDW